MPVVVTEYSELAAAGSGHPILAGQEPSLAVQEVAIGGASAQSNAFSSATRFVRVHADAACRVAFGADPTALASSTRLPANGTEYFGVKPEHKIAVIQSA
jgi:hypothetical protein